VTRDYKEEMPKNRTLAQVEQKKGDSHFWSGLMDIKKMFLGRGGLWSKMTLRLDSGRIFRLVMSL
jgi:hypothetical protein